MGEANVLLEARLTRAGISHSGLGKQLNVRGAYLRLRYDHGLGRALAVTTPSPATRHPK